MGDPSRRTNELKLEIATEAVKRAEVRATAGQFALEMVHEIKNPLEALGHLTYLAFQEAESPEKVRQYMQLAEEQMAALRQIAHLTLGFARSVPQVRPIAALALAEAAIRIHKRSLDEKRIHLHKRLPEDVIAQVHTGEMLQVLSNLIVNAVDALPEGGRLHLRVKKRADTILFTIADNGHGIAEKDLTRLFEPFFTTKTETGTGLGLALSRKIIERHHGTITIRSSVREGCSGTIFRIALPA